MSGEKVIYDKRPLRELQKKYFPSRRCIMLFTLPLFIQLISSFIFIYLYYD